jgi:hypothetical protein
LFSSGSTPSAPNKTAKSYWSRANRFLRSLGKEMAQIPGGLNPRFFVLLLAPNNYRAK